jgi:SAM-dependent methyltransferase
MPPLHKYLLGNPVLTERRRGGHRPRAMQIDDRCDSQSPFKVMSKNLPAEVPFESAAMMADAVNYADWTFSLFSPFIRGEVLEVGCGVGTFTKPIVKTPGLSRLLSIDVSAAAVTRLIRQASDGEALQLRQFYFNAIGALGYFGVYKLLGRPPRAGGTEIGRFDTYVVPIQRCLEPRILPFGIALVSVLARNIENAGEKRDSGPSRGTRKTQH